MHEEAKRAIEALGDGLPQDWLLRPKAHVEQMKPEAGALKRILERPGTKEIIDEHIRFDEQAGRAQKLYKGPSLWSARFSFISVLTASIAVILEGVDFFPMNEWSRVFAIVTGVSVLLSFALSLVTTWAKPFERWMLARAEAEVRRMRLFTEVTSSDEAPQAGEAPLLPLQLEYFRRYQLDVQRAYYGKRSRDHATVVRTASRLRLFAMVLVVLASIPLVFTLTGIGWNDIPVVGGLFSAFEMSADRENRIFLGLGTIGAALQGLLAARLLLGQDERNATRYAATFSNLEDLASRPLTDARAAASVGDREGVLAFVALVQEQVSSEHREWVSLNKLSPDLSLSRLQELALPRLK
ncbi:MAG: hypothetical protein ACFB0F_11035 [Neomegalonema sp.]